MPIRTHLVRQFNVVGGGQSAVSLTPADGEFLSGGVQSNFNSNGWFTRNGYTRATSYTGPNPVGGSFAGFDDNAFLPVTVWLADFDQTTTNYDRLDDVGVNGFFPASGVVNLDTALTRGKWAVVPIDGWPAGSVPSDEDPIVMGVIPGEEPNTPTEYETHMSDAATWLASADGPGRFMEYNFTDPLMNGGMLDNVYFNTDCVLGATGDPAVPFDPPPFIMMDHYHYAGSYTDGPSLYKLMGRLYAPLEPQSPSSTAQCRRGSHYGSTMDCIRKSYPGVGQVNPFGLWIEAAAPYVLAESLAMTPAMLRWSVWSTIVHGARGIHYFVHNFREGDTGVTSRPPWDDYFGGPGIAGTGIYAAMKEINTNALTVAEAINSPWDGYLCFGDGTADFTHTGFLTACTSTNTLDYFGGVDASCRWNPVESKHYIFATTREVDGSTNWPVTFRMVDQGQTTAHPMFTGADITIERGGAIPEGFCEFDDTFATAASYKCYRID